MPKRCLSVPSAKGDVEEVELVETVGPRAREDGDEADQEQHEQADHGHLVAEEADARVGPLAAAARRRLREQVGGRLLVELAGAFKSAGGAGAIGSSGTATNRGCRADAGGNAERVRARRPPGRARVSSPGARSVIAHTRVEQAVRDVGDQVEDDDHHGGDHQERHHRIRVVAEERVDEVEPHPVEREDGLGDDGAAERCAEVERDERESGISAFRSACFIITGARSGPWQAVRT